MKNFINKKTAYGAASIVLMLVIWKLFSIYYGSNFILPSPESTIAATARLFIEPGFLSTAGATIARGLIGFVIAALLGIGLGIPAGLNPNFRAFLSPFLVVVRSVPVVAFILLALIWFSSETVPVFIGLLTMFPLVCTNVIEGIKNVDKNLVEMAKFYKVRHGKIIREVYIPAITPFIFSGISNAMGIGWRAIIVGEVLSQPQWGIGTVMHSAQTFLNVDILIAWTLIAILISYIFEKIIRLCEHRIVKWRVA